MNDDLKKMITHAAAGGLGYFLGKKSESDYRSKAMLRRFAPAIILSYAVMHLATNFPKGCFEYLEKKETNQIILESKKIDSGIESKTREFEIKTKELENLNREYEGLNREYENLRKSSARRQASFQYETNRLAQENQTARQRLENLESKVQKLNTTDSEPQINDQKRGPKRIVVHDEYGRRKVLVRIDGPRPINKPIYRRQRY